MKKKTNRLSILLLFSVLLLCSCTKMEPPQTQNPPSFPETGLSEEVIKAMQAERDKGYNADTKDISVGPDTPVFHE